MTHLLSFPVPVSPKLAFSLVNLPAWHLRGVEQGAETGLQDHEMAWLRRPFCEGTGSSLGVTESTDVLAPPLSKPASPRKP